MSEFVILIKDNQLIYGFAPNTWMIDSAAFYGHEKCCLKKENWGPGREKPVGGQRKIFEVICSVCGHCIYAADAVDDISTIEDGIKYIMGGPR